MGCSAGLISIELVKNLLAAKVMVPVYASLSGVIQINCANLSVYS
jgi:hypothetical protein